MYNENLQVVLIDIVMHVLLLLNRYQMKDDPNASMYSVCLCVLFVCLFVSVCTCVCLFVRMYVFVYVCLCTRVCHLIVTLDSRHPCILLLLSSAYSASFKEKILMFQYLASINPSLIL